MENRSDHQYHDILADFVACTGIQDETEAIRYLETGNWDLLTAINLVVPEHSQRLPSESPAQTSVGSGGGVIAASTDDDDDVQMLGSVVTTSLPQQQTQPPPLSASSWTTLSTSGSAAGGNSSRRTTTTYTNLDPSMVTIAPDEEEDVLMSPPPLAGGSSGDVGTGTSIISSSSSGSAAASSRRKSKVIQFVVHYINSVTNVLLPENKTILDLKREIFCKTGLQICKQFLKGWPPNNECLYNDKVVLSSLALPNVVQLSLDSRAGPVTNGHSAVLKKQRNDQSESAKIYKLNIADLTNSREYHLKKSGHTKVGALKEEIATLSKIPIAQQIWTGWSDQDDTDSDASTSGGAHHRRKFDEERDNLPLYKSGISYPNHDFTVEVATNSSSSTTTLSSTTNVDLNKSIMDNADSDSSMDEYEDASESFTGEDSSVDSYPHTSRSKLKPLIPDNIDDETSGTIHLMEEFETRYGDQRPHFYPGTLDSAIKEACFQPAKERKILAVYLHHDASVLSNVFCSQLLCFESVLQFLTTNCVMWGWDLTFKSNQARFLNSVTSSLGSVAAMTLRTHMEVDRLPALVLIMRMRATTEIFSVINGNVGVSELMSSLIQAVDVFSQQQKTEMSEEEERAQRELIKIEQDEAFQQSLAVDRAKEESRRLAQENDLKEKARLEEEIKANFEKKEALKVHFQSILPPEPSDPPAAGQSIVTVRFRCPQPPSPPTNCSSQQTSTSAASTTLHNGESSASTISSTSCSSSNNVLCRKFDSHEKLRTLFNYLFVHGYDMSEYKLIFGWPRKELSSDIADKSLSELKFCAQETLIVEER